jgi:hypothetical protein
VLAANGNTGYFDQLKVYNNDLGEFVLSAGLSTNNKDIFISTIIDYRNGSSENKVGAEFIIQTMRGGTDHERPTDEDVEDWRSRINNDQIAIDLGNYNYSITSYVPPENTNDVTYRNKGNTAYAMRFYNKNEPSKILYAIDTHCGNPLGKLSGIPKTRTDITVDPPTPVNYDNSGCRPREITVDPSMAYDAAGNYSAVPIKVTFSYPSSPGVSAVNDTIGTYSSYHRVGLHPKYSVAEDGMEIKYIEQRDSYSKVTTTVTDVDTGAVISVSVSYVLSRSAATSILRPQKCYNYNLESSITDDRSYIIEGDVLVNVFPVIKNTAAVPVYPNTKTRSTNWRLTEMVYGLGTDVASIKNLANHESTLSPCDYFRNLIAGRTYDSCVVPTTTSSQGSSIFNTGTSNLSPIRVRVGDYPVGTMVCYSYSVVSDSSEVANVYYNSDAICHKISKKPKTQVIGSDLMTGRQINNNTNVVSDVNTSTTIKSSGTYGSWIEYGILATGRMNGAASDSAYSNPVYSDIANCAKLSFSNNGNTACNYNNISSSPLGQYFTNRSIPSVANSFPIVAATPTTPATPMLSGSITLDNYVNPSSTSQTYGATSDLTINAASSNSTTVAKGKWIVINATGHKVTINSNIRYTSERLYNSKDIPQVVIIADQIDITDNASGPNKVTNLDAWLIATNSINTCSSVPMGTGSGTNLSSQVCNDKLTVNGPVMTNKLYLRRTAGSGTGAINSGDPAEVFNLRADAYMWSYERAKKLNIVKSVYTVELPPRY